MLCQTRCHLKFFSPIWSYVNEDEKKKKKSVKIQNLKFRKSFYNFGTDPPYKYACFFFFFGVNLCYVISEEMSFEVFSPYGPMLTNTKNIRKKSKMQNFPKRNKTNKKKKTVWRYGEKAPFHQIWLNLLDGRGF